MLVQCEASSCRCSWPKTSPQAFFYYPSLLKCVFSIQALLHRADILQEQRSLSRQFYAATEYPAGEQDTWQVGTTWPGRVMPSALWPGSVAGSTRGKNMLLLYHSEFGLANCKEAFINIKEKCAQKGRAMKKEKRRNGLCTPPCPKEKGNSLFLSL